MINRSREEGWKNVINSLESDDSGVSKFQKQNVFIDCRIATDLLGGSLAKGLSLDLSYKQLCFFHCFHHKREG